MRSGLALILVVGVLGILAVLGSAFAVLSRLERRAASQRVQATQAFLLARSGLEDAQARLDAGQDPVYGGEDWDGSKALDGLEVASEVYRPGVLDTEACPVRQALRPSFFATSTTDLGADLKPAPRRVTVAGRQRGYSGALCSGTWTVKARPDGGFNVNGGDPTVAPVPAAHDLNYQLQRMFGILADAIDREDGTAGNGPVVKSDGEKLITKRPATGWTSYEQIRDGALGGSQTKLDALKDYLVLNAWTDLKVVAPGIDPGMGSQAPQAYRMARDWRTGNFEGGPLKLYTAHESTRCSPDLERSPRTSLSTGSSGCRVVGRSPVDLAWARTRRPALLALLGNLRGIYWQVAEYCCTPTVPEMEIYGWTRLATITLDWAQPTDDCRAVADAFMSTTSDLSTWQRFNDFCDSLPIPTGLSDLGQGKKDLIKANFNPNTDVNKFNPDAPLWKLVDKSDLLDHSLELNLTPRNSWKITSVGRLLSGGSRSERVLTARTRPDLLFKLTSQGEFLAGSLGRPETLGDETGFRPPADPLSTSPSRGVNLTFGHKLFGPRGVSLQTYPEPLAVCRTGLPSFYDGQLKLATVETADQEYAGGGSMLLLSRFDDTFDADLAGGNPAAQLCPFVKTGSYQFGMNLGGLAPPESPLWPSCENTQSPHGPVGSLYPDGAYGECNLSDYDLITGAPLMTAREASEVGYDPPGNYHSALGAISFWFKPGYEIPAVVPSTSTRRYRDWFNYYPTDYNQVNGFLSNRP